MLFPYLSTYLTFLFIIHTVFGRRSFIRQSMKCSTSSKVISIPDLLSKCIGHGKKNIVLARGVFDVLHPHHIRYLDRVGEDDLLFVGVKTDELVKKTGGKQPILPVEHRTRLVAAFQCVDYAFPMDDAITVTRILSPDETINIPQVRDGHSDGPPGSSRWQEKITTISELVRVSSRYRSVPPNSPLKIKKTIVFTCGKFDILHRGHVEYLEGATQHGHALCVGVDTEALIKRLKKHPPIFRTDERVRNVAALECVDHVFPFDEFHDVITELRPDHMVISPMTQQVWNRMKITQGRTHGVKIVELRSTFPIASKHILQAIHSGNRTSLLP